MLRGALLAMLSIGLVCMAALSLIGWAAPAPGKTAAPAPTATVPSADLPSLLQASGLAYRQPDKTRPIYHVMVESGDTVTRVLCCEDTAKWKYPDGGAVKLVHLYSSITPTYTQDNEPPAKLLRAALEENDKSWFVCYNINTDQKTGQWTLWVDSYIFLRGATPEVFKDYLVIVSMAATSGKEKFLPLMKARSS